MRRCNSTPSMASRVLICLCWALLPNFSKSNMHKIHLFNEHQTSKLLGITIGRNDKTFALLPCKIEALIAKNILNNFSENIVVITGSAWGSCQGGPSPRLRRRGRGPGPSHHQPPGPRGHAGGRGAQPPSVPCPQSSSLRMTTVRRTRAASSTRGPR